MARRSRFDDSDEDKLAGLWPGLYRSTTDEGPGGRPTTPDGGGGGKKPDKPSRGDNKTGDGDRKNGDGLGKGTGGRGDTGGGGGGGDKNDPGGYRRKAGNRAVRSAEALQGQARALRVLLGLNTKKNARGLRRGGLSGELTQNLKNTEEAMRQADTILKTGFRQRAGLLEESAEDNEKAAAAKSFENMGERGRQRANAISEVMAQGGGESDLLRSQGMSLRNWSANQGEVNRAFHDTLTSINTSLGDLEVDTRSARVGNFQQAAIDKQGMWNNYFDAKSEAWTNLGNTYGQMGQYYSEAQEMGVGTGRRRRRAERRADKAFLKAAQVGSQSRNQAETPARLMNWAGRADFEGALNNGLFSAAGTELSRPEGATLRKWET